MLLIWDLIFLYSDRILAMIPRSSEPVPLSIVVPLRVFFILYKIVISQKKASSLDHPIPMVC